MTNNPITVLGKTFATQEERRTYFREQLRQKLPELKQMEGFPIGEDEDIIALSDPPYYTACPNPWLNDFIAEWEAEKANIAGRKDDFEVEGPYASDVSEGKNNPIYNAHSYHTKVPHPAIMRYILHYTQPGDIVFDGFAGTGMTGVAAQLCGHPDVQLKAKIEQEWKTKNNLTPNWGVRRCILSDISTISTFISYNLNVPIPKDISNLKNLGEKTLEEVNEDIDWLYKTSHTSDKHGVINFIIMSEILSCYQCSAEFIFWDVGVDKDLGKIKESFACPQCGSIQTKAKKKGFNKSNKVWETVFDPYLKTTISRIKYIPVLINYSVLNKRHTKIPDQQDKELIKTISNLKIESWFPKDLIPQGAKTGEPIRIGITHLHHFYTYRNLVGLSKVWESFSKLPYRDSMALKMAHTTVNSTISKMRRFRADGKGGGPLEKTLYIASLITPPNPILAIKRNVNFVCKAYRQLENINYNVSVSTHSATYASLEENSIDYIFTDPPFGGNIMYSELNNLLEAWLKVKTNNEHEAIENKFQSKGFTEYTTLMQKAFRVYYKILKPSKWMTVEFSNTNAIIWKAIQTSIQRAGFIIANVSALDKKQGSFNAVTTTTAVKQDLVISCYKPSSTFDQKFQQHQYSEVGVWDFVEEHLNHLPVHLQKDKSTTAIIERSPKILYDRLVAFYVQRSLPVPLDASAFQLGLKQRFVARDGMYFTEVQVAEYDQKKAAAPNFVQLSLLVASEQEGVLWLKARLDRKPHTYQELHPHWMKAQARTRKGDVLPELITILEENFLKDEQGRWYVPNPEKESDLEKLRLRRLFRIFAEYSALAAKPKGKLKEVRVEALRAGFRQCYQDKDFRTIVQVGDRLPGKLLMEDEVLLQFYDIASARV